MGPEGSDIVISWLNPEDTRQSRDSKVYYPHSTDKKTGVLERSCDFLIHMIGRQPSQMSSCIGLQGWTCWGVAVWASLALGMEESSAKVSRVFCRLGSQHNLPVGSVRRRGLCGAWELSS